MPVSAQRGGGGIAPTLSQLGTRRRWVVSTTLRPLTLGSASGLVWTARKISPLPGFDPRTVQSIASRYSGWTIPAATPAQRKQRNILFNEGFVVKWNITEYGSMEERCWLKGVEVLGEKPVPVPLCPALCPHMEWWPGIQPSFVQWEAGQ